MDDEELRFERCALCQLVFCICRPCYRSAACVVALVDRFAQHCHRVEIIGESWRDKHRLDPDRPPPKPSRSRRKRS